MTEQANLNTQTEDFKKEVKSELFKFREEQKQFAVSIDKIFKEGFEMVIKHLDRL